MPTLAIPTTATPLPSRYKSTLPPTPRCRILLREYLLARNIPAALLAHRLGVRVQQVYYWMKPYGDLKISTMAKLAYVLRCQVRELYVDELEDEPSPSPLPYPISQEENTDPPVAAGA